MKTLKREALAHVLNEEEVVDLLVSENKISRYAADFFRASLSGDVSGDVTTTTVGEQEEFMRLYCSNEAKDNVSRVEAQLSKISPPRRKNTEANRALTKRVKAAV